jgi:hypothetical protein
MSNSSSYQRANGAAGASYESIDNGGGGSRKFSKPLLAVGSLAAVFVAFYYGMVAMHGAPQKAVDKQISINSNVKVKANGKLRLFDELNRYVLEDYDAKSTFSSFLPGVAGYFGKPVWAFYGKLLWCETESLD